jgi:hypothetical protein
VGKAGQAITNNQQLVCIPVFLRANKALPQTPGIETQIRTTIHSQ